MIIPKLFDQRSCLLDSLPLSAGSTHVVGRTIFNHFNEFVSLRIFSIRFLLVVSDTLKRLILVVVLSKKSPIRYGWLLIPVLIALALFFTSCGVPEEVVQIEQQEAVSLENNLRALSDVGAFRSALIDANGGRQRLDRIQGILSTGTFESGGQTVPFRNIKRRPDDAINIIQMQDHSYSIVVNGKQVWQRIEAPRQEPIDTLLEGEQAASKIDMGYFFDPLMHAALFEPEAISSVIPDTWEGEDCLLVDFNSVTRGLVAQYYVDPVRLTPLARVENFNDGRARKVLYGDYRENKAGTLEPHLIETYVDEELQNRVVIETMRLNPGVLGAIFEFQTDDSSPKNIVTDDSGL